jgi:hypothetical protein
MNTKECRTLLRKASYNQNKHIVGLYTDKMTRGANRDKHRTDVRRVSALYHGEPDRKIRNIAIMLEYLGATEVRLTSKWGYCHVRCTATYEGK